MSRPSKDKAIELIDEAVAQFEKLLQGATHANRYDAEYKQAYADAITCIEELFSATEQIKFEKKIVRPWKGFVGGRPDEELQAYKEHLTSCITQLRVYRDRIQKYWSGDAEAMLKESKEKQSDLLQEVIEQFINNGKTPARAAFRVSHAGRIREIDELEKRQLLQPDGGGYKVPLTEFQKSELWQRERRIVNKVLEKLTALYKIDQLSNQPKSEFSLDAVTPDNEPGINSLDVQRAAHYLYEAGFLRYQPRVNSSGKIDAIASGEQVLYHNDIDEKIAADEQQKRNYQQTRSGLFPVNLKSEVVASTGVNDMRQRVPVAGKCFVVIASDRDGETTHESRYKVVIEPAIAKCGYNPIRNIDGHGPNWFSEMIDHLRTCELAVVDLTEMRPNCIWELGILNAWDVPTIVIKKKNSEEQDLPSDILTQRVAVFYKERSASAHRKLKKELELKIPAVMRHPNKGIFLPVQTA